MNVISTLGPPGTGKSTHLATLIAELAPSTPNMCVCSFTRAAAGVLTSKVDGRGVRYIGTLHALAFKALELTKQNVVDEFVFSKWYGTSPENTQIALSVYRYARHNTNFNYGQAFTSINPILSYVQVEHLILSYLNWKDTMRYVDFDDMISMATGIVEPFDVVVVDEAQDCTNEQWKFIQSITKPDGVLYTGSDDDQSLFTWSGANPHAVDELSDEVVVLGQSYRIPKSVHRLAEATVTQITRRVDKKYNPTAHEGVIECIQHYEPAWFSKKHTVLCRDKWSMMAVEDAIVNRGIAYTKGGSERSLFDKGRCALARAIELEDYPSIQRLSKYLHPDYAEDHIRACKVGWMKSLNFGSYRKESDYLNLVNPTAEPPIHLSTIHGFKGEEDDHIILMADCTTRVDESMDTRNAYDDELRVWYVGVTRCRTSLTVVGWNQFLNTAGLKSPEQVH